MIACASACGSRVRLRLGHRQARADHQRPEELPHRDVETARRLLQHHVGAAQLIHVLHPFDTVDDGAVRHQHALRPAGGAGGVDQVGRMPASAPPAAPGGRPRPPARRRRTAAPRHGPWRRSCSRASPWQISRRGERRPACRPAARRDRTGPTAGRPRRPRSRQDGQAQTHRARQGHRHHVARQHAGGDQLRGPGRTWRRTCGVAETLARRVTPAPPACRRLRRQRAFSNVVGASARRWR